MTGAILIVRAPAAVPDITGAVVKIYVVSAERDYWTPWRRQAPSASYGSGCVIDGRRILTSAHVVADARFIIVKRAGTAEKYPARVRGVAHECDLAILEVEDENFFAGAVPLAPGDLVSPRDGVTVYGFPEGGEELSVTAGIVSRVEQNIYAHSRARLLCAQIDAAINPGSSGGPVIRDNSLVGIAFQARKGESISYMVPAPVIRRFLRDLSDGRYDGIPSLEIKTQPLENPDLRRKLGLVSEEHMFRGVVVNQIPHGSPAEGLLLPGDVVLAVDGRPVAYDGTVEFRPGERTDFNFLVQEKDMNHSLELGIFREGRSRKVRVELSAPLNFCRLVPYIQYDRDPTYFIVGGLVFAPMTYNHLAQWQMKDMPPLLFIYYSELADKSADRLQVVVLVQVLADEVNLGYHFLEDEVIVEANGVRLKDFADLVRAVESNEGPYHEFLSETGFRVVLSREKSEARKNAILSDYAVGADRSEDLRGLK
ncbi:MAG: hypothetical protein A2Y56_12540 [Candidatus Aminicenantes bacterium RBG_13_63_10]|nr:MAG: hypothetical protein A2Y56_12540 [Candidatus Aminicenantes bacterium RBG_13_63_10]